MDSRSGYRDYSGPSKEKGQQWGLMIPGRAFTPDPVKISSNDDATNGAPVMSYVRAAEHGTIAAGTQNIVQYYGGTSLVFGPNDRIHDHQPSDPFYDQILLVDNAINEAKLARRGLENPNDPFSQFRETRQGKVQADHNGTVPSNQAYVYKTRSYYQTERFNDVPTSIRLQQYEAQLSLMHLHHDHLKNLHSQSMSNSAMAHPSQVRTREHAEHGSHGGHGERSGSTNRQASSGFTRNRGQQAMQTQQQRHKGRRAPHNRGQQDSQVNEAALAEFNEINYDMVFQVQPPTPGYENMPEMRTSFPVPSERSSVSLCEEFDEIYGQDYLPPTGSGALRGVLQGSVSSENAIIRDPSRNAFGQSQLGHPQSGQPPQFGQSTTVANDSGHASVMQTVPTPVFHINNHLEDYVPEPTNIVSNAPTLAPTGTRPSRPRLLSPIRFSRTSTSPIGQSMTNFSGESYAGYMVFGEQPGQVSRDPTPPGPGRRLYALAPTRMSSPDGLRPATPPPHRAGSAA